MSLWFVLNSMQMSAHAITWLAAADVATANVHSVHVEAHCCANIAHLPRLGNGCRKCSRVLGPAALQQATTMIDLLVFVVSTNGVASAPACGPHMLQFGPQMVIVCAGGYMTVSL